MSDNCAMILLFVVIGIVQVWLEVEYNKNMKLKAQEGKDDAKHSDGNSNLE